MNHIDTAAFYFSPLRSANELINRRWRPTRTTSSSPPRSARPRPVGRVAATGATPEQLRGQVEENLRQLGRDHLDVVNLRIRGTGLDRRALRRARRAARGRPDPAPGHLQRPARAPRRGAGDRARRLRAEPLRHRRASPAPTRSCASAASRASRSSRSSPSPATGGESRRAAAPTSRRGRSPSPGPTARRRPGPAGVDAPPGTARAGDPGHRQPRPPGREHRRRGAAPLRRTSWPPWTPSEDLDEDSRTATRQNPAQSDG